MSGKYYPDEIIKGQAKEGVWLHKWKGCASSILLQEEAAYFCSILKRLRELEDISEELDGDLEEIQESICHYVKKGEARMRQLHSVLGGFDHDDDGEISKPDSELVMWPSEFFVETPQLELVKGGQEKGESR